MTLKQNTMMATPHQSTKERIKENSCLISLAKIEYKATRKSKHWKLSGVGVEKEGPEVIIINEHTKYGMNIKI